MLCCVSAGGTATKVGGGGEPAVGPAPGAAASLTSGGTCRGAMASARKRRSGERPRAGQRGKGTGRTPVAGAYATVTCGPGESRDGGQRRSRRASPDATRSRRASSSDSRPAVRHDGRWMAWAAGSRHAWGLWRAIRGQRAVAGASSRVPELSRARTGPCRTAVTLVCPRCRLIPSGYLVALLGCLRVSSGHRTSDVSPIGPGDFCGRFLLVGRNVRARQRDRLE